MISEAIVIGICGFAAVGLFFGKGRLWAAVISGVLSWKYADIAVYCMFSILTVFFLLEAMSRMRGKPEPKEADVIDVEFSVVSSDGRKASG